MMIDKSAAKIALMELRHDIKLITRMVFMIAIGLFIGALFALLSSIILQICLGLSVEMAHNIGQIVMGVIGILTALFLVEYDIAKRIYNA